MLIAVPMVSAFVSDALFGYFIAARQFLWVLPAVALLSAAGLQRHTRVGLVGSMPKGTESRTSLWSAFEGYRPVLRQVIQERQGTLPETRNHLAATLCRLNGRLRNLHRRFLPTTTHSVHCPRVFLRS
jgi:hypothetical protein